MIAVLCSVAVEAQAAPMKPVLPFPGYKQMQGQVDKDGFPTSGAKLCLIATADVCFAMPSHPYPEADAKGVYEFGLEPKSERLELPGGGALVLFTGTFSAGGSGTLERLVVLRYEADGSITNLLPYVAVTNQSDRAMWQLPEMSPLPILVTADFLWDFGSGETHLSKHFYQIHAYRYDASQDRYVEALSYKTAKRYPGLDDVERVRVLVPEREEIVRRLRGRDRP